MYSSIGEFVGPFAILNHDERSKIVFIDQDGEIKRYLTSQVRLFLDKPSMIDDSIAKRKIEDGHVKTDNDPDELEFVVMSPYYLFKFYCGLKPAVWLYIRNSTL